MHMISMEIELQDILSFHVLPLQHNCNKSIDQVFLNSTDWNTYSILSNTSNIFVFVLANFDNVLIEVFISFYEHFSFLV